uniref:KIB1-4 beta-propeller domain-containing protein n=1 Tax=Ananas comosus var. bracteatus TaxID=296719 RepID=A0A6V7PIE1_ANACO|nr:unnamed protein product [Ananas comosus var. bracteatus]
MECGDPTRRKAIHNSSRSRFPTDILIDVASKHVTSATTYTALRSVCRSWRAALPATVPRPHRLPPQLPFLLLLFSRRRADDPAYPAFFSLTTNRTFDLHHLADARESICIGSCYGWLFLLFPDFNLVLRNPVTGDTIHLPSLDGTIFIASPDPFIRNLLFEHQFFIRRAILSSDPSANHDFLVALFSDTPTSCCLTWRSGDNFWTVREHPKFVPEEIIFYRDHRCIAIGPNGTCAIFDFASTTGGGSGSFFTRVPKLPVSGSPFLVESAGNVWLVTVNFTPQGEEAEFWIHRLDFSTLPNKVTAVPAGFDIGGRIWFLGQCNSMSVASTHFPGFEGDSIYLAEINWYSSGDPRNNYTANIWEYQLKNVIAHRSSVQGERRVYSPWPQLWWIPPNLHKKLGE